MDALDVIILCGGRGTRLGALTATTPKPLLPVGDAPFLLHRLVQLKREGIARVLLAAHYLAEQFRLFVANHEHLLPETVVLEEPTPLGTGGALRFAAAHVRSPQVIAMNGDSWVDQPLAPLVADHVAHGRACTVTLVRADRVEGHARAKGVVSIGPQGDIVEFHTRDAAGGWVNGGLYVMETAFVKGWPIGSYELEQCFLSLVPPGRNHAFCSKGRLVDIGTPEVYERADAVLDAS